MKDMLGVIRIADLIEGPALENRVRIRERPNGGVLWGQFVIATPLANVLVDGFLCCGDFAIIQSERGRSWKKVAADGSRDRLRRRRAR